jgi:hypothetical protein
VRRVQHHQLSSLDTLALVSPSATIAWPTIDLHTGKSVWLYYVLLRCLAERRPVILRYRNEPFLFIEDGVYLMQARFQLADYKTIVWALVDSDIPDEFITQNTPFFVISATSAAKEHWSRLDKTTSNAVIVMNPWTRGEIHQV